MKYKERDTLCKPHIDEFNEDTFMNHPLDIIAAKEPLSLSVTELPEVVFGDCAGTAGTAGTLGSFGGCYGSVGTYGSYGCGGGAADLGNLG